MFTDYELAKQDSRPTSLRVAGSGGSRLAELRFKAWGETRYTYGSLRTKFQFTGQRNETADIGLYFYNARWYDPVLGRFAQADTVVPGVGNSTAFDRYAYTLNNTLKYVDPTGHDPICILYLDGQCARWNDNRPVGSKPFYAPGPYMNSSVTKDKDDADKDGDTNEETGVFF